MLRIAIVEKEDFAKDIIFALQKILKEEFSFVYYEKISTFIKDGHINQFDIIILNEAYNNVRVTSALEFQKNNSILLYCSDEETKKEHSPYSRIFTINRQNYHKELEDIRVFLEECLVKHKEYLFSYNGVHLKLKYHDIYYIEKEDKNLIYHTKKGDLYERGSIAKKSEDLLEFDFIRIHSGIIVNYEYIFRITSDEVEMQDHTILPISRARRSYVANYIRNKAKG